MVAEQAGKMETLVAEGLVDFPRYFSLRSRAIVAKGPCMFPWIHVRHGCCCTAVSDAFVSFQCAASSLNGSAAGSPGSG